MGRDLLIFQNKKRSIDHEKLMRDNFKSWQLPIDFTKKRIDIFIWKLVKLSENKEHSILRRIFKNILKMKKMRKKNKS